MSASGQKSLAREHIAGNVFLVGMMGAGKTSMGKVLARRLNKTFLDCDHEIERLTGVKVAVIFEIEGETGFRQRETKTLAELVLHKDVVLATGGGAVLSSENRRLLAKNGVVIYLRATAVDLWNRTRHDKNRPLLRTADPRARLEQLHAERDPLYREVADIVVDTGSQSLSSLAQRLEQQLLERQAGGANASRREPTDRTGRDACKP